MSENIMRQYIGKEKYFDSDMIQKGNVTWLCHFPNDYFAADVGRSKCSERTILQRMLAEVNVYMRRHQRRSFALNGDNVIYHKFSHDFIYIRFNEENANAMLELCFSIPTQRFPRVYYILNANLGLFSQGDVSVMKRYISYFLTQ